MLKIKNAVELKAAIQLLEYKQGTEMLLLKEEFCATYEKLKPINIIKSTFKEAISAPDLKTNLVDAAIGIATGYVAKKIFVGKTHNPVTKLLGTVLEIFVAKKTSENADGIKSVAGLILEKLLKQKHESPNA